MESYEKFDYSLRPNKRTQRKMIFDALSRFASLFPNVPFRYVGFGSMWFSDFLYAHRRLGVRDLVSVERESGYVRAKFNRPFKCVRVVPGDASVVLPKLSWKRAAIVWLDYDYKPEAESLQDIAFLSGELCSGSVLMVTYEAKPPWDEKATPRERASIVRSVFKDAALPALVASAGSGRKPAAHRSEYPSNLVSMLWSFLKNCIVQNGRAGSEQLVWNPLFSFLYQDGAPMITIGAALLNPLDRLVCDRALPFRDLEYMKGETIFPISIPPLTPKERAELDRRLPSKTVRPPFPLSPEQVDSYRTLYRYYPLFAEVDL